MTDRREAGIGPLREAGGWTDVEVGHVTGGQDEPDRWLQVTAVRG